eukprot:941467-Prymnesium_polylepis.1
MGHNEPISNRRWYEPKHAAPGTTKSTPKSDENSRTFTKVRYSSGRFVGVFTSKTRGTAPTH